MKKQHIYLQIFQFLSSLLNTKRVSKKHKFAVRLHDPTIACQTLYPGLISHMIPLDYNQDLILSLLDLALSDDSGFGYAGALHLVYHLSEADIDLKLEVAKKVVTVAFNKLNSSSHIAKQVGWQESIGTFSFKMNFFMFHSIRYSFSPFASSSAHLNSLYSRGKLCSWQGFTRQCSR